MTSITKIIMTVAAALDKNEKYLFLSPLKKNLLVIIGGLDHEVSWHWIFLTRT